MSVQRSNALLDKLSSMTGMTEAGKNWVTACVDPFHDTPINCTGFPDTANQSSVVQCVKLSSSISMPSAITTATWDCVFNLDPCPQQYTLVPTRPSSTTLTPGGVDIIAGSGTIVSGGIDTNAYSAGTAYDLISSSGLSPLTLPGTYVSGPYRLIAVGFEVINTTSELYRQGTCTVYRQNSPQVTAAATAPICVRANTTNAVTGLGYVPLLAYQAPPQNIADAVVLAGSLQWEASKGCYVQGTLNSTICDINSNFTASPYFYNRSGTNGLVAVPVLIPQGTGGTIGNINYFPNPVDLTNFNPCGAIFSGLSPQTTLTLNVHFFVERFPDVSQPDLVVLATPSPAYDPIALEFYSHIVRKMPVACKQGENSLGSWFKGAVQTARDWVAPIASLIPHPAAQAVSKGLYLGGAIADNAGRQAGGGVNTHEQHAPHILQHAMQNSFRQAPAAVKKKEVKKEVAKEVKKETKKILHAGEKKHK